MASEAPSERPGPASDTVIAGSYYFLDVGAAKYGECVLAVFGDIRVLIDGGHQQDFKGQAGYPSIPAQLADILGGDPPYAIDLLVVTHGHSDHVGALPDLVEREIVKPEFALIVDPGLGFGRARDEDTAALPRAARRLEAALREEYAADLADDELDEFLDAAETVEARYARLIAALGDAGTAITFYRGQALPSELQARLAPSGMTCLGPSQEQLLFCAEQIARTNAQAQDAALSSDAATDADVRRIYRSIVADEPVDAGYTRGNAMNCQSITLAFGPPGERVLLAGDMQFADPGVRKIDAELDVLRQAVIDAGPYAVFKTTHHTAHNGQDEAFLEAIGNPQVLVHCGGWRDESHPNPALLKALSRQTDARFVRTDHNGLITVRPADGPADGLAVSRGSIDDFTPNVVPDAEVAREPASVVTTVAKPLGRPSEGAGCGLQIIIVNLPNEPVELSVGGVEIVVRSSDGQAAGGRTIGARGESAPPARDRQASHDLDDLLFVTDPDLLRANVGRAEADEVIASIERRGGRIVEGHGDGLSDDSVDALSRSPNARGVVLLGGYDVVPAHRADALDAGLRQTLGGRVEDDSDQFWVWSDAAYADTDGDGLAERPVSRIPDARDARLLQSALRARTMPAAERFGIRNVARPFAGEIWPGIAGNGPLHVSGPFLSAHVVPDQLAAACHYLMLHGDHRDGTAFTGEDPDGYPVAFEARQVPERFDGVVLAGCCWGALTVEGRAVDHADAMPPPRVAEGSIALRYLRAGALAFVGCTGAHYSGPSKDPRKNYAYTLHQAFWEGLRDTGSPALALHEAKQAYAASIVSGGVLDPVDTARRLKNMTQFTCLGLGWR